MNAANGADGNRLTFEELYTAFWPRVYGYVARQLGDRSEAEDITAEVFARAFEAYPRFEPRPTAAPWLFTIARHACWDFHRKRALRERLTLALAQGVESEDPAAVAERRATWRRLRSEIERLPLRQQQALRCFHQDGLSFREAAGRLRCSEDAAKMLCHRGVKTLRQAAGFAA